MKSDVKNMSINAFSKEILSEAIQNADLRNFLVSLGVELEQDPDSIKKINFSDLLRITEVFFKIKDQKKLSLLSRYNLKTIDYTIFENLLQGKSNKEIATKVQLSEQAIKYHLSKSFKKFKVKNREELRNKLKEITEPDPI